MIKIFYLIIIFYLSLHLVWHILREKKFWNQLGAALVLVIFLLRLLCVK